MTPTPSDTPQRTPTRTSPRMGALAVALTVALLGGCTTGNDTERAEPSPDTTSLTTTTDPTTNAPETTPAPITDPAQAAADVFDAVADVVNAPAVATANGTIPGTTTNEGPITVTADVLQLSAEQDSTFLHLALTGEADRVPITPRLEGDRGHRRFAFGLALVDPATGTRYLPLQYSAMFGVDGTSVDRRCICPDFPMRFGPEPEQLYALYPALPPDVTTVTVVWGDSGFTIDDVPVTRTT